MRPLKVGDKVYGVTQEGFDDFKRYSFSVVVKLTKTLAILKNGIRLVNDPRPSYIIETIGYSVYKQRGMHWYLVSINAIRQAQIENRKIEAHDWFKDRQFTIEEKQLIYEFFTKKNE